MMNFWTNEDIEAIMVQLNKQDLPFKKYEFSNLGGGMSLLGSGASANVYEAMSKGKNAKEYAIKVIGFSNKHADSEMFQNAVDTQMTLSNEGCNVVTIHDFVELRVWIEGEHNVVKVDKIEPYEESKPEGNYLHLQFILMEKISPVLISYRRKHKLTPYKLSIYDEKEIMKLAYEIGMAIYEAHKKNCIHRDIKLENIFYDGKHYKLGDFGVAVQTDDGMASSVIFTKGYGAPEVVGTLEDRYDYTADIYSFGMLLYVLLNELRFPESSCYQPTVYQYFQGYIPPEPVNGSDELIGIVLKMLSFNPDDRYQSMEEVLNEFDRLKFGPKIKYQREHKSITIVLSAVFALIGAAIWKLSFMPELHLDFSIWSYIFCGLCIAQTVFKIFKKKTRIISIAILVLGICLMILSGFTWWKLVLLPIMAFSRYCTGIIGGCAVVSNVTYLIMNTNNLSVDLYAQYRWIAVLLLSLAVILSVLHMLLGERDEDITKIYFSMNLFWILMTAFYLCLILTVQSIKFAQGKPINLYEMFLGQNAIEWILSWNPQLVGICGMSFCIIWMIREKVLSLMS